MSHIMKERLSGNMVLENLSKSELIKIIKKQEAIFKELQIKYEELLAKYEKKVEANKKMTYERFCPKKETLKDDEKALNEAERLIDEDKEKSIRKTPTENFLNDLRQLACDEIICDFDFKGNNVDKDKVLDFGQDETYKIEILPANFKVVKVVKKKYKDKDKIYEAISDDVFPHSPLTPSLAANIIAMKYELLVPINRYSLYLSGQGLNISPQTLGNYVLRAILLLEPLYDKLLEELFNNSARSIHSDETTLQVIESNKDKCYMFVYTTSFWNNPIYIYEFSEDRRTTKLQEHMKNYEGYLTVDGYTGYNKIKENNSKIKIQRCFIHCRRNFFDCIKTLSHENKLKHPAYKVVKKINELFEEEKRYRKLVLDADTIKEKRNSKEYQKIISELNQIIDDINYDNNPLLEKAVKYYYNYKDELFTYLEDGHVDMSNNIAERTVKPFVIGRKNFLFCKTLEGAKYTGIAFSIVQTARANGLQVEKYLKYVIENIGKKDIQDLLPWSDSLPSIVKIKQ